MGEGYQKALQLLRDVVTQAGIVASTSNYQNYNRIWARDGIVAGLAGLLAGDSKVVDGLRATIITLKNSAGEQGQIPSNIESDATGKIASVSYGGRCGRVDTTLWFIIGVCHYVYFTGDRQLAKLMEPSVRKGMELLKTWEYNSRGLIYVPQSGDWADEHVFHGYILYDQLMRLWAARCVLKIFNENIDLRKLKSLIQINYWPWQENAESKFVYQPRAFHNFLNSQSESSYFLLSLTPGGYFNQFDALSNALCVLLNVASHEQSLKIFRYGNSIAADTAYNLLPCFWPPVQKSDPEWQQLQNNCDNIFRNEPYQYQNGGIWPIMNAWWGMALVKYGKSDQATKILNSIHQVNKKNEDGKNTWDFFEYAHAKTGKPGGTRKFSWSAAGAIMLTETIRGNSLLWD